MDYAAKVGRSGASDFDFSAARMVASVDESLTRDGIIFCHDSEALYILVERFRLQIT